MLDGIVVGYIIKGFVVVWIERSGGKIVILWYMMVC